MDSEMGLRASITVMASPVRADGYPIARPARSILERARTVPRTGRRRGMGNDHEQRAADAERELADMEERSQRVGEHIDEARKDWDKKVADPGVPGAGGNPERAEEEDEG